MSGWDIRVIHKNFRIEKFLEKFIFRYNSQELNKNPQPFFPELFIFVNHGIWEMIWKGLKE